MFAHPRRKERAAARRQTHSVSIRTRRGRTLVSQLDASRPSSARCEYDVTTTPTSHGLLPMSPLAFLSDCRPQPATPPNVRWLLQRAQPNTQPSPRRAKRLAGAWVDAPLPPPHAPGVQHNLCASQQSARRSLTAAAERRAQAKHQAHLAQTRFRPNVPGVPPPFVPWGSIAAAAPKSASAGRSTPSSDKLVSGRSPLPINNKPHAKFFSQTLRPYHGSPLRLLDVMSDGKRRTSDLVKCIRAGQVDSMDLSLAIQIPDGFEAVNATRIQANIRGRSTRRQYLARKKAAVKIQAAIRGKLWRNQLRELNWNALWIQTVWRTRKIGWRPWMCRSPMCMDQIHRAATVIQANRRMKTQQRRFSAQKLAAITIQKHVRGVQGRAAHEAWLVGKDGPAAIARKRERMIAAMKQATALLVDDGTGGLKRPAKALEGCMAVYKEAPCLEVSYGVPQLSQRAVILEMRNKLPTVQNVFEEFRAEVPPNVYEMVACVDWAIAACGTQKSFDWSQETEQWVNNAKQTLQKNGKAWADKQVKAGHIEEAVLSYTAALRFAGDGSAGNRNRKKINEALNKAKDKLHRQAG